MGFYGKFCYNKKYTISAYCGLERDIYIFHKKLQVRDIL